MCTYLDADSRRHLTTLFDERVTDVTTRRRLRDAWGLCNWHTWMALDARASATGVAIVYEDLLRVCHERVRPHGRRVTPGRRVLSWLGRIIRHGAAGDPPGIVGEYRARERCALCAQLRSTEAHCLDAVLHFVDDAQFGRAYQRSAGLCVPHLIAALERGAGTPGAAVTVQRTLDKWQALRGDLARFVAKHEYRNAEPISEEEARSYRLALEILAGRRNLFGSHMV